MYVIYLLALTRIIQSQSDADLHKLFFSVLPQVLRKEFFSVFVKAVRILDKI